MRWMNISFLLLIICIIYCIATETIDTRVENEELIREKRVAVDDMDFDDDATPRRKSSKNKNFITRANDESYNLPVVLPAYGHRQDLIDNVQPCMLYLENITVVVLDLSSVTHTHNAYTVTVGSNSKDVYYYSDEYVKCPKIIDMKTPESNDYSAKFVIDLELGQEYVAKYDEKDIFSVSGKLSLTLNLEENYGVNYVNTQLNEINIKVLDKNTIKEDISKVDTEQSNLNFIPNIRSYYGYSYACGSTQAIWFNSTTNYVVGIAFNNVQIQTIGVTNNGTSNANKLPYFSQKVADCESTFSPGSWMGIIVAISLITVLMFGFLMLNSIQTLDRLDDPKQKQIVINFKE